MASTDVTGLDDVSNELDEPPNPPTTDPPTVPMSDHRTTREFRHVLINEASEQFHRSFGRYEDGFGGPTEPAVQLEEIYKSFPSGGRRLHVLNGFTMRKCYTNRIYVLYGAIESGKTTILRIILNMCQPDYGSVHLFGVNANSIRSNRDIGYMPQNCGFYDLLSVEEIVFFYAVLKNIDMKDIRFKLNKLKDSLAMMDLSVRVCSLQQHQKRILSFFIAGLHDPKILLLDEPSSGCDPVYKHFIWRNIRQMVAMRDLTVLLTAADESECMWGDVMGFVRNGRLIAEDAPNVLLKKYNVAVLGQMLYCVSVTEHWSAEAINLEPVQRVGSKSSIESGGFTLSLDIADDDVRTIGENRTQPTDFRHAKMLPESDEWKLCCCGRATCLRFFCACSRRTTVPLEPLFWPRWRTMLHWRVLTLYRNVLPLMLHIVLPIFALIFYYYAVNGLIGSVQLGVVAEKDFFLGMDECRHEDKTYLHSLACRLDALERSGRIELRYFPSLERALMYYHEHRLDGILKLDEMNIIQRGNQQPGIHLHLAKVSTRVREELSELMSSALAPSPNVALSRNVDNESPVVFKHEIYDLTATDSARLLFGCLVTILHLCGILNGAIPLTDALRIGIIEREYRLGINDAEQQMAHLGAQSTLLLLLTFLLQVVAVLLMEFDRILPVIPTYGRIVWMFLLMFGQILCGFAFGVLLYKLFRRPVHLVLCAQVLQMFAVTLSGFLWHHSAMEPVFQLISHIIPHNYVSAALQKLISKDDIDTQLSIVLWSGVLVPMFWTFSSYAVYFLLLPPYQFGN